VNVALVSKIQHRAVDAIENAQLVHGPWPHLEIQDFLPWDFYAELLAHWPTEGWKELVYPDQRKPDGSYRRQQLMLSELDVLPELLEALRSPTFHAATFDRLNLDRSLKAHPFPMLVDDEPGYWIRQHPDTTTKIVTLQIFLPEDDSTPEMGTELVGPFVDTVPFLPNSGYAFHPTRETIHQVRQGMCEHRRRSIMVIWYDSDAPNISYFKKR
jgi:hypothetical protein